MRSTLRQKQGQSLSHAPPRGFLTGQMQYRVLLLILPSCFCHSELTAIFQQLIISLPTKLRLLLCFLLFSSSQQAIPLHNNISTLHPGNSEQKSSCLNFLQEARQFLRGTFFCFVISLLRLIEKFTRKCYLVKATKLLIEPLHQSFIVFIWKKKVRQVFVIHDFYLFVCAQVFVVNIQL